MQKVGHPLASTTWILDRLEPVLREQDGYVTSAQARELGISGPRLARLVDAGLLRRVRRGLYVMTKFAPSFDLDERVYAAWLALDASRMPWERREPVVVASHSTAAGLQQLGTYVDDAHIHLTTPDRGRRTSAPDLRLHRADLPDTEWRWMAGRRIMVTTPSRTVVDMALEPVERSYVLQAADDALAQSAHFTSDLRSVIGRLSLAKQRDVAYLSDWVAER